ncbi:MAG: glutamate mutase L, partial [Candidatus Izemoplasmataceae bacterium]
AEIGSTTTIINAFNIKDKPVFLGRGVANTTVSTDVREGLEKALNDLKNSIGVSDLTYNEMFATSSAAGGLKVTVSGLVYEMTVKAAKEAALNAGANIHYVTAGEIDDSDIDSIKNIGPNMIIIAGGTDYGEKQTAYNNLIKIEQQAMNIPLIYAGNIANHDKIKKYFETSSQSNYLKIVENVFPRVDFVNILPLRKVIYETFEEHIVHAKGMEHIKELVNLSIMPTPGSVMESTMRLHDLYGNIMTIDVGGATTDVHSVCEASDEYKKYAEGEAKEKRTVEGDLGVFINFKNVLNLLDYKYLIKKLDTDEETLNNLVNNYTYIPKTPLHEKLVYELTKYCVFKALDRHVGDEKKVYTSSGQKIIPEGKDLTQLNTIILTGGPLVHLNDTKQIIYDYIRQNPHKLMPKENIKILIDRHYIMASIGVLSLKYPLIGQTLLNKSFSN